MEQRESKGWKRVGIFFERKSYFYRRFIEGPVEEKLKEIKIKKKKERTNQNKTKYEGLGKSINIFNQKTFIFLNSKFIYTYTHASTHRHTYISIYIFSNIISFR